MKIKLKYIYRDGDDLLWNRTVKLANNTATDSDRILKSLDKVQQAQKRPR